MTRLLAIILVIAQVATPTFTDIQKRCMSKTGIYFAGGVCGEDPRMTTAAPKTTYRFCEFAISSSDTIKKDTCFKFVEVPCQHDPLKTCAVLVKVDWEVRNTWPPPLVVLKND